MSVRVTDILSGGFARYSKLRNSTRLPARLSTLALAFALALAGVHFNPSPASADLKLCNTTSSRIGVVIGYKDAKGWTSEGWWNIPSNVCWTLIKGDLVARYYYLHAIDYDRPGVWDRNEQVPQSNTQFYLCTEDKAFEIRGTSRCEARGFITTRFFEVDTTDEKNWTVTLQEKIEQRAKNQ